MNEKFLTYDLNTQKIRESDKENYMQNVLEELQSSIINYVTNKLSEQEIFLFNFPESSELIRQEKLFFITVNKLVDEILKSNSYYYIQNCSPKFKGVDKGELEIDYPEICALVNYIIYIIINLPKKNKISLIHDFCFKSSMPKIDFTIKNLKLSTIMEKAKNVKEIKICLSNKKNILNLKDKILINIKAVQLFCLFFSAFFNNLLIFDIDLNVYEINKFFNLEINPYKINTEQISKAGQLCKTIFL